MVNRIHPYASYHIKRFFQYLQRLDNDPVRSALESYMENHRKATHNDFHNQYDLGVGNSIGSLGLRMVHQALASDWTTETRGRFIEAFLASDFATEAARTVFLNFLYCTRRASCRAWTAMMFCVAGQRMMFTTSFRNKGNVKLGWAMNEGFGLRPEAKALRNLRQI